MIPTPSITALRPSRPAGILLACLLGSATLPAAPEPSPPLVESLTQNDLQQAFRALRNEALGKASLSDLALNRAALAAILETLGPGAELLPATPPELPVPYTNLIAPLPGGITYIRAAVLDDALLTQLRDLPKPDAGIVLDLRCPGGDLDTDRASQFAALFSPPEATLFSLVDSDGRETETFTASGKTRRRDTTVVLIDSRTSATAEVVAASVRLSNRTRCLLVGEPTPGHAARYETVALGTGARLRYAKAGIRLPDGTRLFDTSVLPDIETTPTPTERDTVFLIHDPESLAEYLTEKEKPVLNEAALMAGTNPELPALLLHPGSAPDETDEPPARDAALVQAIDFLTSRAFLDRKPPG